MGGKNTAIIYFCKKKMNQIKFFHPGVLVALVENLARDIEQYAAWKARTY